MPERGTQPPPLHKQLRPVEPAERKIEIVVEKFQETGEPLPEMKWYRPDPHSDGCICPSNGGINRNRRHK